LVFFSEQETTCTSSVNRHRGLFEITKSVIPFLLFKILVYLALKASIVYIYMRWCQYLRRFWSFKKNPYIKEI